jgi:zinc transporter 9
MHAMQEDSPHEHSHSSSNGYADNSLQRKKEKPQMRDTLAAVGGMLIPLLTQIGHHH